ncbi:MAG: hypothetical protein Q4B26_03795 [Eubacteriales bacterium]|nr:hypothetical protein [Eubacteriales bacterium]
MDDVIDPVNGVEETDEMISRMLSDARNMEARKAFHAENLDLTKIADIYRGNRKIELFRDTSGKCWYETWFVSKEGEVVSEYDYLFKSKENFYRKHGIEI